MNSRKSPYFARIEYIVISIVILALTYGNLEGCSNPTTTFPIIEDFESNSFQQWTQDPNDDFNWTTHTGATTSGNTGPTGSFNGSYYAYTEATTPNNPSKVANLISPCFAVQNGFNTEISFAYHMFGSGMGSFNLDISTNDGASWTNLWGLTGNQGTNWIEETIDLNAYVGQDVKLRFNVITGTYQSDVSIDDVMISSQLPEEICDDDIDNDGDGLIDCEDNDCGMISNNEFDQGTSDWNHINLMGNISTFTIDATNKLSGVNSAKVDITFVGSENHYTQLEHNNLSIESGKTYRIYFNAKSSLSRNIEVMVQQTFSPFTTYLIQDVQLANFNGQYAYEFTATATDPNVDLSFNLGQTVGTVWIDNVQFKEVCPKPLCILPTDESFSICSDEVLSNSVATNDVVQDETYSVTYQITGSPSQGNVALEEDGSFVYTPNAGASGVDSFTYERCYSFKDSLGLSNEIFNPCGDGKIIEPFIAGIEGEASPSVLISNPGDLTRVIVEVWAESACGSVVIEGQTADEIDLYRTDGTIDTEKIYKTELSSVSPDGLIEISQTGGCTLSSAVAYVERIQANGQGSSSLISSNIDLYHSYVNSGDDCFVYNIPIGTSDNARDVTFTIPLHEKDNVRTVTATIIAGAITETASTTSWTSIGQGAGEFEITLQNVPGDISVASIEVCSPDVIGDSFGVGMIAASSLVCTSEPTYDCCAESITTINLSSASISNSSPNNCFGNGLATLTAIESLPGLNPIYEWSHSNETTAEVTVAPVVTTTYTVTITNDLGCSNTASTTVTVFPELTVDIDFNGTLCLEENSQLTANASGGVPAYQYSWTGPNSFTSTLQTIDVNESGNYYVTVTDSEGCSESFSAYVYEAYEPFIFTLNTEVCEGENVTLSVNSSSAVQFNWGPNAGNATTSSVTVTPSPPSTEYTVTVTNDLGCQTSASAIIDVISKPIVNVTGPASICEGETSSLSPTTGGTWVSSDNSVATVSNSGVVTGMSAGTVTFIFTNSTTQCESLPSTEITVLDRPVVSISGPTSICEGFTSQLSPTTGGVWTSNDENIATVDNNGVVTGVSQGSTTFVFTNTNTNCSSDATQPITVDVIPTVTVTGSTSVCIGGTTTLSPSTGGIWSSSDNSIATVSNSGVVMGISVGSATFTFTSNQGCVSSPTASISVNPEGTANISGESIICEGETTTLSVSTNGGTWNSSNNGIASINSSGVVTAISSGTVTITYEYPSESCFQDPSFVLEVKTNPTVSISGTTTICVGENTQLTTSGTGGFWSSSDSNIAIVSSSGIVVGVAAGTVSFTYTSSNGCESDATGLITVDPAVEAEVDFNGSLCLKDDSQLSAIVTGGTASYTYTWTGPGGFSSNLQTIDIALNGNYNLTVTDSKGCSSNTTAFVYEAYEPFIFALNTDVCEGEEVTLSVNSSSSATYQWGPNAGNSTGQSVTVTPGVPSTSYTVTVTNSIGCTTEASAVIGVDPKPTINISGPTSICEGGTTQLTPSSGGIWTSSDYEVANINNTGLVTGISNGTATFTFRSDATGCYSDPSSPITVSDNGIITISGENQICIGESPTLVASVPGGSWSSSNVGVAQVSSTGVITPNSQGVATITYTPNSTECYFDATYEITIHPLPNLNINGPSIICENEQTYLSASTSGTWTSSDPLIANVSNTGVVTGFSAGTVTFSFVSSSGCPKTLGTPVTVIGNPEISLNGPGDICINATTSLLPNSGGVWISSNTNIASVSSSGIVTGVNPGIASFTFIEFSNGCISENSISINVNGKPNINGLDDNELCIGATTNITPSTGGSWTSTNPSVATIDDSGLITAIGAGTATFHFTNNLTGCTSNASAPLTVHSDPVTNFLGPTTICVGEASSISPISNGFWASTDVSIATISSSGEILGIAPGTVQFIYTSNSSGCSSAPSEILTVDDPTEIQITGPSHICIGENTSMSPSSGGVWQSSNTNIAIITNGGIVTGLAPGEVTFIFNSNTGCTSDPSTVVTVDPEPNIQYTGPSSICIGTTTSLSPSTGGVWTSSQPSVASIDNNGLVTGLSAGSAIFTFEDNLTGCSADTETALTVYTNPTISISGDDQICIGSTTNMIPSSGGVWVSSDNGIAVINSSGVVTGMSAGTVTFTFYENGSGCISNASDPITILPKPIVNITGNNIICEGETTTLSPSSGGSWTSNNVNVATVTNQGLVTGISQGLVKFTFTSNEGCASEQTSPVIVYGKPSISVFGSDLVCTNETGQMLPSSGGTWSSTNQSVATIDDNGVFTALSAGTVRFIFTDSSTGCISEESDEITVNDSPEISIIGPDNICVGGSTNLFPTTGGIWTSLDPGIANIENNGVVNGLTPGQTRFIFTSLATGCSSDTSSFIVVEPGPVISYTGPQNICIGETTSITPATGGTWMSTNNAVATIDDNGIITAISQGSAKFIFTENSTGCNSELSDALNVNGPPTVLVSGPDEICIGGITNLTPSTGGIWTSLQPSIATVDPLGNVIGVSSGVAYFVFTDSFTGCESDGALSVTILEGVDVSITGDAEICLGYTTTLHPSSGGSWTSSNPLIASVSNSGIVKALAPGVVTFEFIEAATGCAGSSPTDPVTVSLCTNHDFNVTLVDVEIQGNVGTNDDVPIGTTYGGPPVLVSKPLTSIPVITLNQDGTYSFSANKEGKYIYAIPVCIPPQINGCATTYLEVNVIDGIYSHSNPVSNLEFSTSYTDVDELQNGMSIDIDVLANDKCVFSSGCDLDPASVTVNSGASNGSTSVNPAGIITYTPEPGFIGKDTIYYSVCVLGNPSECSESFEVVTVNDLSALNSTVAADDFGFTLKETPISANVMTNDSDPEGDAISVVPQGSLLSPVSITEGEYYIESNGDYAFTPANNFSGSVDIVYTLCDDATVPSCMNATIHLLVLDDISIKLRVYLEGALMMNGGEYSTNTGYPLMRDDLRVSPYTGQNYIPISDPYTFINDPFMDTPSQFYKMGPGLIAENTVITDSLAVFSVEGENAIVDWVYVELRSKDDYNTTIATRSGLLQRDGDVVDLDGVSDLRFNGVNVDSFYVVVKHRSHLGVMSEKVENNDLVDFTSPTYPVFNYGTTKDALNDYTGLSQKLDIVDGYAALWAGDFDSSGKVKFTNPEDDLNILFIDVLFSSPEFLINYNNGFGYFTGDYNMNSKAKYTNPEDDVNFLFSQVLLYPLNTSFFANFNALIEQVPPRL